MHGANCQLTQPDGDGPEADAIALFTITSGGDGHCASNGAFSTGVPIDWGLSQRPARVDCGLSYTTGQATIAR